MGGTGLGTGKGRGQCEQGGNQGEEVEKATLVGDVQECWGFYTGERADTV